LFFNWCWIIPFVGFPIGNLSSEHDHGWTTHSHQPKKNK
jgi:hypothetical protein